MKSNQCPMCGSMVFETLDMKGWRVLCKTCDYTTPSCSGRYEARVHYRNDFNQEFDKGFSPVDVKQWQERLDNGML